MGNIPFIGREKELELLEKLKDKDFFMVVRGRRRIGKTTLIRKAFPDAAYIFIWPDKSYQWIVNEICTELNLPKFSSFIDILRYLLDKNQIIILDELQNFLNIDKSVFGEMQKLIDDRKIKNENIRIIVSGSSYSLITKVFNLEAAPLYGRRTHEMMLLELPLRELFLSLEVGLEEFIKDWSVFGGVPYYYTLMDPAIPLEKRIIEMIELKDSMLLDEGKVILSVEFGKDSKTYNTALTAIAEGKTKLNEISSLFSDKKGETIKYLDMLRNEFNLVRRVTPILVDPDKSREGVYEINDNFLSFWFYFIDKQKSYLEQERFDEVTGFFKKNFPDYAGRKFEKFVIYLLRNRIMFSGFGFTRIGRQWGRIANVSGDKNQYEIDVIAVNDVKSEILFCECKWKANVDAKNVLEELSMKASYVDWNAAKRKDYYAVFAKSFSSKVKEFDGKPVFCFDLHDIDKALRSKSA